MVGKFLSWFKAVRDTTQLFRVGVPQYEESRPRSQPERYDKLVQNFVGLIYRCASLNASAVAALPLRLYVQRPNSDQRRVLRSKSITDFEKQRLLRRGLAKSFEIEEVTSHPFLDMMREVNPFDNAYSAIEMLILHQELTGNGYHFVRNNQLGQPMELWPLLPQHVRVIPSRQDFIKGYEYKIGDESLVFDKDEVIHYRYPNPADQFYGMGRLEAAGIPIALRLEMEKYELALFRNSAVPELLIKIKGSSRERADQIQSQWNNKYKGSNKAGMAAVVNEAVEIEKLGLSQKDMTLIERMRLSNEEIANVFGVPMSKLTTSDVNRANAEAGNLSYAVDTVKPITKRTEQQWNQNLVPRFDDTGSLFCAFDDPVPADKEERRAERQSLLRISTINEQRAEDGLPSVAGGDVILVEVNKIPLSSAPLGPQQEIDDNNDDEQLSYKNIKDALTIGQSLPVSEEVYAGEDITPAVQLFADDLAKVFSAQRRHLLQTIELSYRANGRKDRFPNPGEEIRWQLDVDVWSAKFNDASGKHIREAVTTRGQSELDKFLDEQNIPQPIDFSIQNPRVAQFVESYQLRLSEKLWGRVVETTNRTLRSQIMAGIAEGESTDKLAKRIETVLTNAERHQSMRIARTERIRASNAGAEMAWQESGVVEAKEWIIAADACEFCQTMRGKRILLGEPFVQQGESLVGLENGLMNLDYSDIPGPPLHPNCRCTLAPIVVPISELV